MQNAGIITGAGTGVGRATALALANAGWAVALIGRTESTLRETRDLSPRPAEMLVLPCDVADAVAVARVTQMAIERFGAIAALVCSAGTNIPKRALSEVSVADFDLVMRANLDGTFHSIRAILPSMRARKSGTIVAIASIASLVGLPLAGAAYTASKFAVRGLMQSLNSEERKNGIRGCAIFPGEINTPLLDRRAVPPPPEHRAKIIQPEDIAECVMLAINLPARAVIEELTIMPR